MCRVAQQVSQLVFLMGWAELNICGLSVIVERLQRATLSI
jgi:hypothetical protein